MCKRGIVKSKGEQEGMRKGREAVMKMKVRCCTTETNDGGKCHTHVFRPDATLAGHPIFQSKLSN